jgi:hypothetical protein
MAEAVSGRAADFDGDAVAYLQACYTGRITPDPLRMSAAVAATRCEKPSLSASLTASVGNPSASAPTGLIMLPPKATDDE